MKIHNLSSYDLYYRLGKKSGKLGHDQKLSIPETAKTIKIWYEPFNKAELQLTKIKKSDLLTDIDAIVMMTDPKINIRNSLIGYTSHYGEFLWKRITEQGYEHIIFAPDFVSYDIRPSYEKKEVDPDEYNDTLDKISDPSWALYYWAIIVIVLAAIIFVCLGMMIYGCS